jgi:hypothetical protein
MRAGATVSQPAPRHLMAVLATLAQRLDCRRTPRAMQGIMFGRHAPTGNEQRDDGARGTCRSG